MSLSRAAILLALAALIGLGGYLYIYLDLNGYGATAGKDAATGSGSPMVTVSVPATLSARARIGKRTYEANCAACHGRNAAGQEGVAPPLVHVIYERGHHGDESFRRAVALGVRAHHWGFGDMAPVEGLSRRDVAGVVAYIRELQRANGIH